MNSEPTFELALDDERLSLPSASGYARLRACPGSFRRELASPASQDTVESASGTRIHAWLASGGATEPTPPLTPQERDTAEMCQTLAADAIASWLEGIKGPCEQVLLHEQRLYLRSGLMPVFSGQPDYVQICGERALILDYKTGWGETPPSPENPQLMALAVLLWAENPELEEITVGIVQPTAGMRVILCTLSREHLEAARLELMGALSGWRTSDELRTGEHCTYCRAKANCPAAMAEVETISRLELGQGDARRDIVDNATLAGLLDRCGPAEKMIAAIRAEAKRRIEAGESVEGWTLAPGATRRTITDAQKAFGVLATTYKVTPEEFAGCCKAGVTDLENLVRQKTGMKAREAKAAFNQALEAVGALEMKAGAAVLERV